LNLYKARSCTEKFIKANQLWESKTGAWAWCAMFF
jgi:hypothetical protein